MTHSTEQQPPKIEFPCENYSLRIIGDSCDNFVDVVLEVLKRHAPEVDPETVVCRDSSKGRFVSAQVSITAKSVEHLEQINQDLRETGLVRMVL
ncbi:DUF493 family protein [Denitrificimonas sp. JX-1]|uniref:UPF0250 protein TOI97_10385 n=1 Tax=Denitrificimonas halotolerans TaxID=3098930 RepID=A0ABU5GSK1_9GAMM|nr:DUF493 family protein [Denitrificimonas sp. JX-1]MDY7219968.1 DUF493 family protein [Denitrificimonas sp. JX-1]